MDNKLIDKFLSTSPRTPTYRNVFNLCVAQPTIRAVEHNNHISIFNIMFRLLLLTNNSGATERYS